MIPGEEGGEGEEEEIYVCTYMYMRELVCACGRGTGEHAGCPLECVPSMFEDMFILMVCDLVLPACVCGVHRYLRICVLGGTRRKSYRVLLNR